MVFYLTVNYLLLKFIDRLIGVELKSNEAVSLIMEYIVGTTLDNIIRTYRNLNESAIQSFVKQIVDGVAYMHMQVKK